MRTLFASSDKANRMNQLGVVASYLGFFCTVVGLAVGFYNLPTGDSEIIFFWLAWVPVGFILLLMGITTTQLTKK
jgi:uncharacterized membrane protein